MKDFWGETLIGIFIGLDCVNGSDSVVWVILSDRERVARVKNAGLDNLKTNC